MISLFHILFFLLLFTNTGCTSQQGPNFSLDKYLERLFRPPLQLPSPEETLQEDALALLDALKCGDVEAAMNYATLPALQSLLILDIDRVDHFAITQYTINEKWALVDIYLNKEKKPFKFRFQRDTIWRFKGVKYKKESHRLRHIYYPHLY